MVSELRRILSQVDPDGRKHGFHVAMSAETYRVLQRQYAANQIPDRICGDSITAPMTRIIWEDLWIAIDHRCEFGQVLHREGWKP